MVTTESEEEIYYTKDKGPTIGVRHVQVILMSIGSGLAVTFKSMFSVTIVAMTDRNATTKADVPIYDWDNVSVMISAIFWGSIVFQLISGYLGRKYGPKWFVFWASLIDSIAFILIPLAADILGSNGVIALRFIQGLTMGIIFPMNMCITSIWIPTEERSKMGFIGVAGITIFVMVTSTATGYISESVLGWPWIFYIFGSVSLIWTAVFGVFARQSPETHPGISQEEKLYIQVSLNSRTDMKLETPWLKIFTSIHFWAIVIGQTGFNWMVIIITAEIPLYISNVLEYGVKENGIINAIAAVCGTCAGLGIAVLSDYLPKSKFLSLLNSRRLFHTLGTCGICSTLLLMTFISKEYKIWAIVVICMSQMFMMFTVVGGSNVNALDISPTYSSIIFGWYDTIAQTISFFAPLMIQWVVKDDSSIEQWRTIFIITVVIGIGSAIFFDIFASATRQKWDKKTDLEIPNQRRKSSLYSIYSGVLK